MTCNLDHTKKNISGISVLLSYISITELYRMTRIKNKNARSQEIHQVEDVESQIRRVNPRFHRLNI